MKEYLIKMRNGKQLPLSLTVEVAHYLDRLRRMLKMLDDLAGEDNHRFAIALKELEKVSQLAGRGIGLERNMAVDSEKVEDEQPRELPANSMKAEEAIWAAEEQLRRVLMDEYELAVSGVNRVRDMALASAVQVDVPTYVKKGEEKR